jgi:cytidine deaminase
VFAAVAGGRASFVAVAVSAPAAEVPTSPCGACRQVLSEFCPPETPLYFEGKNGAFVATTIGELLPHDTLHGLKDTLR